jgi:hypothetical protein
MNGRSMKDTISRRRLVMFGVLSVAAGAAAFPRSADAAKATGCMDGAWAEYNDCLVGARWEAMKKLCDLYFYADAYACVQESIVQESIAE